MGWAKGPTYSHPLQQPLFPAPRPQGQEEFRVHQKSDSGAAKLKGSCLIEQIGIELWDLPRVTQARDRSNP